LDTAMSPLAGGTSHPATETMIASLDGTPYDTGLTLDSLLPITEHFRTVRRRYRQFESDFTGVDAEILTSQIPGGMLSNLAAQLTEQNALDRIKEVLDEVPRVRKDMGYPPLVTPTSQIVGTQATLNVLTGERYKVITTETKNYFLGLYGRAPGQVDRDIMARAIGNEEPIKARPADRLEPELDAVKKDPAVLRPVPGYRARLLRGAREGRSHSGTPRNSGGERAGGRWRTASRAGRVQSHRSR
jgi:pyruvate carboxylase subunit B